MRALTKVLKSALIAGLLFLIDCGTWPLAGGTSTSENGVVMGMVVDSTGLPESNVQMTLLPAGFNPMAGSATVRGSTARTDHNGRYRIPGLDTGSYVIESRSSANGTNALISDVRLTGDSLSVPTCTLHTPGMIKIKLSVPPASFTAYAYIPGTDRVSFFEASTGIALLKSVPAGTIHSIYFGNNSGENDPYAMRMDIPVLSGDTTLVTNTEWKYARKLCLNTTASGAAITGDVLNFPVLVRLNSGNFIFSQAKTDGADIRFTKLDNTQLPYEIEQWNAMNGSAEIWVKLDTVRGNSNRQIIMMYSGNSAAADSSSSLAVFDTATGFQGVWHLNEYGNGSALDATANRYDGTAYSMGNNFSISGVIGNARAFDGSSSCITMPNTADSKLNFSENGYFSVSAWVYVDSLDSLYRTIVAKGHEQYFLQLTSFPSNKPEWEFSTFSAVDNWHMSTSPATGKQWVLLTGVREGSNQYLYCNGELAANTTAIYPQGASRDTTNNFSIGRFMKQATFPANFGYCYFKGKIDEVRVCSVARNQDWIRLSYMNQRGDDRLIQYR